MALQIDIITQHDIVVTVRRFGILFADQGHVSETFVNGPVLFLSKFAFLVDSLERYLSLFANQGHVG